MTAPPAPPGRPLRIRAGFDIAYDCPAPTPMVLMLSLRPERHADLLTPEQLTADPDLPIHHYRDGFGNVCSRVLAPAGLTTFSSRFVVADTGLPDAAAPGAEQHRVEDLPDEVLVFLLASRYCDTEPLSNEAWRLFGATPPGWARVQAVVDYAHARLRFSYPEARPTRTAYDAHGEQVGVCRDFAHLAVALCRCLNIPARYVTGYLGDIGTAPIDSAMDFSAWFEVYLGGAWRTFDARHNRPRIGRILMAVGRDAADVAITTHFGPARLARFEVTAEVVAGAAAGGVGA